ncbi:hypothetical protein E6P09_04070 [Haloferax mediterranei ATCC 33500]|nr:hypothetical protein [Haloferax mediterranei]AHZ22644.1 hypothetical protein BM92_08295 [Haloferax mediterranei ATCC 33500]MDX5988026.1 hypothetical protein [Haloferax mediterranei ATCC 33500]QCQ74488.1 hypothetical protein E6P09_04070 [Haloferax mediterranei ATCC 33500]
MPSNRLTPEEQYEITYRAMKNALWHVLGTSVYLVFLIFAAAIGLLTFALPALGSFAQGNSGLFVLGVGLLGVFIAGFAFYRIYQLLQ